MAEKLDSENILLITDSYKVRRPSFTPKFSDLLDFLTLASHFVVSCASFEDLETSGSTTLDNDREKGSFAGCYQICYFPCKQVSHHKQYPSGTTIVFSYFESRGGKFPEVCFFGLQYLIKVCTRK